MKKIKIINDIINLKLKFFFKYLISLLKKRDKILKVQFFTYLKSNKLNGKEKQIKQKEINKILISQILFH